MRQASYISGITGTARFVRWRHHMTACVIFAAAASTIGPARRAVEKTLATFAYPNGWKAWSSCWMPWRGFSALLFDVGSTRRKSPHSCWSSTAQPFQHPPDHQLSRDERPTELGTQDLLQEMPNDETMKHGWQSRTCPNRTVSPSIQYHAYPASEACGNGVFMSEPILALSLFFLLLFFFPPSLGRRHIFFRVRVLTSAPFRP